MSSTKNSMTLICLIMLGLASAQSTCIDCSNGCIQCEWKHENQVMIKSTCKDSTISWMDCCKDDNCLGGSCPSYNQLALYSADKKKCDETTSMLFNLSDASASTLVVSVHDGRFAGNFYGDQTESCGGAASACAPSGGTGVCDLSIDLTTCPAPPNGPNEDCTSDEDCPAQGPCSVGRCTGEVCQQDFESLSGTVCRAATGVCDVTEVCSGESADCPDDEVKPATHVCRSPVIGNDGTTCDLAEHCPGPNAPAGVRKDCPPDGYAPEGTLCRPNKDLCDLEERCDGTSITCPADQTRDYAYTFKCSTTQYLCGVNVEELNRGSGRNTYFLSTCNMGAAKSLVSLETPDCLHDQLVDTCPNNRGISNFAVAKCNPLTGDFEQCYKQESTDGLEFPLYPITYSGL